MMLLAKTGAQGRVLAMSSMLLFAVACGDANYKLSSDSWGEPTRIDLLTDLEGSVVELARLSSRCSEEPLDGLVVLVGSHMEFPAHAVRTLKSPCTGVPEVGIEIDLEGRSILYDFSNVVAAGRFPGADFEGFSLTDIFGACATFRGAQIDRDASTMNLPDDAISFEAHSLLVNLADMEFDSESFLKIDVLFEGSPD
jgi:hypothetical protein